MNVIANTYPAFLGGSADVSSSTKTYLKDFDNFSRENYGGKNFNFGVREHAMGAFINGFAAVRDGEKWYIVDETLKKSEKAFDHIKTDFVDVAFRMQRGFGKIDESYYLIDTSGEVVNGEAYEDADVFFNGYAAVEKNGKWGFIDENGTQIIEPQYDDAKSFANGYAAVCRNGEWFFIDEAGEEVISGDFSGAYDMRADGCAFV